MMKTPLGAMLYVKSVKDAVSFYRDKLGFKFSGYFDGEKLVMEWHSPEEPGYAGFDICGGHLGLHPNDGSKKVSNGCEFHVVVDNVDEYYSQITARGVKAPEPVDEPWGGRCITLQDPDGHVWDFYHMVKN